jgi:hypothetical protein
LDFFKHAQRDKSLMRGLKIQAHVLIRELYIEIMLTRMHFFPQLPPI